MSPIMLLLLYYIYKYCNSFSRLKQKYLKSKSYLETAALTLSRICCAVLLLSYNVVILTWAVGVICEGHLEGMSVVEDLEAGGWVVLQTERLQPRVVWCVTWCDVNGRLTGSVGNRKAITPFVGSWNNWMRTLWLVEYSYLKYGL